MAGHAFTMVGREAAGQVDELLRHRLAGGVPVAAGDVVRRAYCPKTLIRCCLRGHGRVVTGLDVDLGEGDGQFTRGTLLEGGWASSIVPQASIVARAGQLAGGRRPFRQPQAP